MKTGKTTKGHAKTDRSSAGASAEVTLEESEKKKPEEHEGKDAVSTDQAEAATTHADAAAGAESMTRDRATPSELDELQSKVASLEESLLRAKADYQNLQRRTAIERSESLRYANADLMCSLLTVLDDFERALTAAESSDNLEAVVEGVRLVQQNLMKALTDAGLEPIDALHQPFDPTIHEALMRQPSDEHPEGTVIEQVARGYKLRDRVLRPAKVIVASKPES